MQIAPTLLGSVEAFKIIIHNFHLNCIIQSLSKYRRAPSYNNAHQFT